MQISRRTRIGKPWPLFELFRDKTAPSVATTLNPYTPTPHLFPFPQGWSRNDMLRSN